MGLESVTHISDLVVTNPTATDPKSQGDDHIRNLKIALKTDLPNITGPITASQAELNIMDGVTASTAEINILDGVTASTAEINLLDGVTASTAEINRLDGITGPAAAKDGETYSGTHDFTGGTPLVPTQAAGDSSTKAASTAFVAAQALAATLPAQTGNSGKSIVTNGTTASWGVASVVGGGTGAATFTDGGVLIGNGTGAIQATSAGVAGQVLVSGGPGVDPAFGSIVTGSMVLLSTVTANNSATVDVEATFDSTYDEYLIVAANIAPATNGAVMHARFKIGGSYITTGTYDYHVHRSNASATTYAAAAAAAATSAIVTAALGDVAASSASIQMWVHNPVSATLAKTVNWTGCSYGSQPWLATGAASNSGTSALTGVRFFMDSGNVARGTFRLYGIKNS